MDAQDRRMGVIQLGFDGIIDRCMALEDENSHMRKKLAEQADQLVQQDQRYARLSLESAAILCMLVDYLTLSESKRADNVRVIKSLIEKLEKN